MTHTILVVGNINLETSLQIDGQFPLEYSPVRYAFNRVSSRVSGVGYNLAKAIKTLSVDADGKELFGVRFATLVANDPPGKLIQQTLREEGLLNPGVVPVLPLSPQSVILYEISGRRQVNTDLKDLQERVYPLDHIDHLLSECRLAIISNINYARPLLSLAKDKNIPIVCDVQDISNLDDNYNQDFLKSADILFMSHEKLPEKPLDWARQVHARFGTPLVIIGLGGQGALLLDQAFGDAVHIPAAATRPVVNTAGAGDALLAAFAQAFVLGQGARTALQKAVIFAGHKIGAQSSSDGFLDQAALELLYKRHNSHAHILLDDAPEIPGLTFRYALGPEDAPALLKIHLERQEKDHLDQYSLTGGIPALEQMERALAAVENDPSLNHRLMAEINGTAVAYTNLECWQEADDTWVYLSLGWVKPMWRGKGLGTALLHFSESKIRHLAAKGHAGEKIEMAANASVYEPESAALLLAEGYRPAFTVLEMQYNLDSPLEITDLPEGLQLHPVRPDDLLQIARSVEDAYRGEFKDHRFADRFDLQDYIINLSRNLADSFLWMVAWNGDEAAGQVLSRLDGNRAEITEVSVRPAYRRRGIARALLGRALGALRSHGVRDIRLQTVAEFPTRAVDLYHSLGFKIVRENPRYRKPL